jgi:hypothetical protein
VTTLPTRPEPSSDARRFSDREVRLILKEAAELQERETGDRIGRDGMTLAELEQVAADVGLDPALVRRAAARVDTGVHDIPTFAAAPMRVILEREVEGELPESSHEEIVDTVRRVTGQLGAVSIIGKTITWGLREGGEAWQVVIAARNGRTIVRVENNLAELASVVQGVSLAASILGVMVGGGVAYEIAGGWMHAVSGAAAALASIWLGGRFGFRAGERSARRAATRLLDAVEETVSSRVVATLPSTSSVRTRDNPDPD